MKSLKPATLSLAAGLLLAACGSADTPATQEANDEPLPTPAPTTTIEETQASELLSRAPDKFEPGECLIAPSNWIVGDFAVAVDRIEIGPRYEVKTDPWNGQPGILRDVTLSGVVPLSNLRGIDLPSEMTLTEVEAIEDDLGGFVTMSSTDYDAIQRLNNVVVIGRLTPEAADSNPVLAGVFGTAPSGGTDFAGPCTASVGRILDAMAPELGLPTGAAVMTEWLKADGEADAARFIAAEEQLVGEDAQRPDWNSADPSTRSLNPIDLPADVYAQLDVRGAFIDVQGVPEDQVIAIRTDSGISSAIAPPAMGSTIPLFYLPERDTTIEIVLTSPTDMSDAKVLTSIEAEKLRDAGGILVSGTIEAIEVEILSRPQLAEQLGVSEEQLENMRADMLAVDEQR